MGQLREKSEFRFENVNYSDIRYFTVDKISDDRIFIRNRNKIGFECDIDILLRLEIKEEQPDNLPPTDDIAHASK